MSTTKVDKHGFPTNINIGLTRNHCAYWSINDAIREIIQNTVDGAKEYVLEQKKRQTNTTR